MSRALQDLVDSTLGCWYAYLSSWQAPGELAEHSCIPCSESPFLDVANLRDWPHDVAHELVRGLDTAVRHVYVMLEELEPVPTAGPRLELSALLGRRAQEWVIAGIRRHEPIMLDVLEQCVAPSLDDYLRSECDRGILELFGADRA